jgi:DNA sulfur modification protein DndB
MITIKTYGNLETASLEAGKESQIGGGRTFMVTLFRQGTRENISAVFPIEYIINELRTKATEKDRGIADVIEAMNRPLDPAHAKNTQEYLKRNYTGKYILPAMTLNIQDAVNVYTADYPSPTKPGYLVIPYGVRLSVTDGQHRKRALEGLYKELPTSEYNKIKHDGIPVMITLEDNINQVHQDFADCSKTKPLPKSLIAVYDRRNPANSLVLDLVEGCPLFTGKVDATSQTLSKKSIKIFLVSQIRGIIKELLLGNSSVGDVELENRAIQMFEDSGSETYKLEVQKFKDYLNRVTKAIPILSEVANMKQGMEMSNIPIYREQYLILNSAGINLISRIGHEILRDPEKCKIMEAYIKELGNIDWRKSSSLWKGNIVSDGAKGLKIQNSNSTLKAAFLKVKEAIGLA